MSLFIALANLRGRYLRGREAERREVEREADRL